MPSSKVVPFLFGYLERSAKAGVDLKRSAKAIALATIFLMTLAKINKILALLPIFLRIPKI